MPTLDFPDNLIIELYRENGDKYVAKSTHVQGAPPVLHGPRPLVVDTYAAGATPVDALDSLLDAICRGEAVGSL